MSEFEFRLRFHFPESDHIEHDTEELVVLENEMGCRLRLESGERGIPIKERSRAVLIGSPYQSEEEARQAATLAKRALLIWAVTKQVGVDLGNDRPGSGLMDNFRKLLEVQCGRPIRNDIHGVDVYPHQDRPIFWSVSGKLGLGKNPQAFVDSVASYFRNPLPLTEKQVVACELYCSIFFDISPRSRLITLVSAVEALLEPPDRSPAAHALVDHFKQTVRNADLDKATKEAMTGTLGWLCKDSIGQTARALSERLLPGREYLGKTASRFFTFCYGLRSQIVHKGRPCDPKVDLPEVANACKCYVADLLRASWEMPVR